MSNVMKISPCLKPLNHIRRPLSYNKSLAMRFDSLVSNSFCQSLFSREDFIVNGTAVASCSEQGSTIQTLDNLPISMPLEPISSEAQFDRVITEAQELQQPVVIVWAASWCRKCIYLKPKLEKLAAHYYPSIRFYYVDVNNVPHKLVAHAEVTKMPTIQLWYDGKKEAEVIGSHKAYLVVNDVRQMIENDNSSL